MGVTVLVDQYVPGDPRRVYESWTVEHELARWWWPHITDTTYRVEPVVGGRYDIRSPAIGIGVEGEFLELDPGNLIVMSWRWLDDGTWSVEETVRVEFMPALSGTEVLVIHELDDLAGEGEGIRQGWVDVLARLAAHHTV